ncbi:MAG TPA: adenylate/guanylate cyclase domain-containing protein [Candidatus Acidoferrales bacterium]|nr:adenylate/guanylate cyclase domain-containing protein [Candidatus Acidoferrales bacterium]
MKCPKCHTENLADSVFCEECSAPLEAACPTCGAGNRPTAKFCRKCRSPLTSTQSPAPSPQSYTPKHLADKILTSRVAIEGERKQVTVLFADVKGSMDLAGQVDPEDWHRIMDRFFAILADGVHRFEGTVNQYTGDGIMALFGAPIAHEDHTRRACYAALHLTEELRPYANELRLRQGLNFSVRMGINSGEVIVGKIGDDLRMDYTAQGHTVGLAARMEQIAEAGKVYLTEHAATLVHGFFQLGDLGQMQVKGVPEPLRVYELQGVGQFRTRLDISRTRGFSRFVGRAEEMQVLESALARAQEGNPQIIGIVGEAGLGKSRLCAEFLERCRASGLMTYEATGVSHGKAIPFLPILQLCRAFFGITEQDSDTTARERIAGRLLLLDDSFRESLPLMFDFLGVPDPELPVPRMDPEARQRQIFAVFRGVIQARGQRETSVTLLEDLHWFDGGSEAFLEPLLDARPGSRGLVMLNFRPEYRGDWTRKSYYQQLALQPLGTEAIRQLLVDLLGTDSSIEGLAEAIHARTAGNPFFSEEVVQSLIESGKLVGTRGSYRLVAPIDKLEVPGTVHAVLAARIDRLPEREKQVLQTAAVIGKTFHEPILKAVAALTDAALAEALQVLKSAEFIYEQALYPVAEFVFKHPLTQEVAYGSQLQDRRAQVHAAVARAIEAAHADKLDEQAALLAHHWEEAGARLIAAGWHRRAAKWSGTKDIAASMRHWKRVRELIEADADAPEAAELGAEACRQTLAFGFRLGLSAEEEVRAFSEGKRWTARSGDVKADGLLETAYSAVANNSGRIEEGVRHALAGQQLLLQTSDEEVRALAPWTAIYPHWCAGQFSRARELAEALLDATRGHPEWGFDMWQLSAAAFGHFTRGAIEIFVGNLDSAKADLDRGVELARQHGDTESEGWALSWFSDVAAIAGDAEIGLGPCRRSIEIAEKMGSPYSLAASYHRFGVSLTVAGRWPEAIESLEHALAIARERGTGLEMEARLVSWLAEACLGAGDLTRARALAEESVVLGRRIGVPTDLVFAQRALVHVLFVEEGAAAAIAVRAALDEAERLIAETGATSLAPLVLLDRAELARLEGDAGARERTLRKAQQLFADLGAPLRVQQIDALLAG